MGDFLDELRWDYLAVITAVAWISFAEHPTAKSLRRAIIDTIGL